MKRELQDVQAGFRKDRGTRDQIASICWIIEKARTLQKNICFIDYAKAFDCVDQFVVCGSPQTVENSERDGNTRPPHLLLEKPTYMQVRKQQLELDIEQTGSK